MALRIAKFVLTKFYSLRIRSRMGQSTTKLATSRIYASFKPNSILLHSFFFFHFPNSRVFCVFLHRLELANVNTVRTQCVWCNRMFVCAIFSSSLLSHPHSPGFINKYISKHWRWKHSCLKWHKEFNFSHFAFGWHYHWHTVPFVSRLYRRCDSLIRHRNRTRAEGTKWRMKNSIARLARINISVEFAFYASFPCRYFITSTRRRSARRHIYK